MIKKILSHFGKFSLQKQYMYIIVFVVFLPIFLISITATHITYKKNIEFNTQLTLSIAEKINSNFITFYNDIENTFLDIILSPAITQNFVKQTSMSYNDKYTVFTSLKNNKLLANLFVNYRFIENISIISDKGYSFTYINSPPYLTRYYDQNNQRLFDEYSQMDGIGTKLGFYLTDFEFANNAKKKYVSIVRGIYEDNRLLYVISVNFQPSALGQICSPGTSEDIKVNLINSDYNILFDENTTFIGEKKLLNVEITPENLTGSYSDKGNLYFYFTNLHKSYYMLVYVAKSSLNSSIVSTICIIGIASILIGLLIFYIATSLSNTILKPISVLTKYISDVGDGNFSSLNITTQNREISMLIHSYNDMSDKISEMIQKIAIVEKEKNQHELLAKNLELEALQSQINPHFIYNTLAIINGYAIESDNDDITEMTLSLSSLLRYSLGKIWETTTLENEIQQAKCYFKIQSKRHEYMPQIDININGYENCKTTRLFLQPLLENIFLHAFPKGITDTDRIWILAHSDDGKLFVDISDNGIGMDENYLQEKNTTGKHIGLFNVHRRIQLEFGTEYGCSIHKNSFGGTTITVCFPDFNKNL